MSTPIESLTKGRALKLARRARRAGCLKLSLTSWKDATMWCPLCHGRLTLDLPYERIFTGPTVKDMDATVLRHLLVKYDDERCGMVTSVTGRAQLDPYARAADE